MMTNYWINVETEFFDRKNMKIDTSNGSILYLERTLWKKPSAAAILDFEFSTRVAIGHQR
jgi:hypothetical protein